MGWKVLSWCGRSGLVRALCLVFLAIGLFGCDHATKFAAKANLEGAPAMAVAPGVLHGTVSLQYVQNDDIAFNAFRTLGVPRSPLILASVGSIAILSIAIMLLLQRRVRAGATADRDRERTTTTVHATTQTTTTTTTTDRATAIGLALIFGGALGNLVDRIARGYVIDFIHVKGWPVFNVADIAVVAGMILMALPRLRLLSRRRRV